MKMSQVRDKAKYAISKWVETGVAITTASISGLVIISSILLIVVTPGYCIIILSWELFL